MGTPQEGKGAQEDLCAPLLMEWQVLARRRKEIKKAKTRVMPSSHLNDPEYWRDRAKEARAIAEVCPPANLAPQASETVSMSSNSPSLIPKPLS